MSKLKKLKASTIVESIVAMMIISICFGVALVVLAGSLRSQNPELTLKAYEQVQRAVDSYKLQSVYLDQTIELEGLTLECKLSKYGTYQSLRLLEIRAYNNGGRMIIKRQELLRVK